ncbi:TadE/TadG family type IV pilus assembly protein [Aquisediminimonas sediminicola]|uniref:TadE/TadG family type IV pilus assembly protein n=1 Tax=Alteraquisediminimonas sediminicola TaxID=2676787 RepID=UPI001FE26401|nr:pilus assembly protein [Aquisediminimonas sediminicola]
MTRFFPYRSLLRRLLADRSGLAFTEFALSIPLLVGVGLFGLETINLATTHLILSNMASQVANSAGRVRTSIDEADVKEIMLGADMLGKKIKFSANGIVILSSVEMNPKSTGQWIRWQRCFGAKSIFSSYGFQGSGAADNTLLEGVGPKGRKIIAPTGSAVMFVELVYDYQRLIPFDIYGARTIRYLAVSGVRERTDQAIKNASNTSILTCLAPR